MKENKMEELVKRIKVQFISLSPVLFSHYSDLEKQEGETPQQFEERTWRERAHYNEEGKVIVPGFLIKSTLEPAAKLLGKRVNDSKMGKSLSNYIRLIQIEGDIITNVIKNNLIGTKAFVTANGQIGGSKVPRTYPKINKWEGILEVVYPTIANALNDQIVMEHLQIAGSFVGIGHWRPGSPSCGSYGRFKVIK